MFAQGRRTSGVDEAWGGELTTSGIPSVNTIRLIRFSPSDTSECVLCRPHEPVGVNNASNESYTWTGVDMADYGRIRVFNDLPFLHCRCVLIDGMGEGDVVDG